jgi:transposase
MDPYHLVAWGSDALDKVRRQVWNSERGGTGGRTETSVMLKGARWALWKNPERLSEPQRQTLAVIQKTNKPLYRAYLLKEQLREIVAVKGADGKLLLAAWLRWAGRSRVRTHPQRRATPSLGRLLSVYRFTCTAAYG